MMWYLLFIPVLFTLHPAGNSSYIDWSPDRKLHWSDFQGRPDPASENAALTSSHINFSYGYGPSGFSYHISCRFDKKQSWVRMRSSYILSHEQGHFDIAEIYARKLNRALRNYHFRENSADQELNALYDRLAREHHEFQQRYDRETDHSRDNVNQAMWSRKIEEMLQSLQADANYPRP